MARRRDKQAEKRIARDRVFQLLDQARIETREGGPHANRYAAVARRVATRFQLRLPTEAKQRICRKCNGHLLPGHTSRTRIRAGKIVTTCLQCDAVRRRPIGDTP